MPEPGIRVRPARNDDAEALSAFSAAVFPLGCPPGTNPRDLAQHIATKLTAACFRGFLDNPNALLFVAENLNEVCGCVLALHSSPHPQMEGIPAELQKLYVAPAQHGRGVADALMSQALTSLGQHRVVPVWLSVNTENPRAIAFYRKWDFQIVGTHEILVGADLQKDFLMLRNSSLVHRKEHK